MEDGEKGRTLQRQFGIGLSRTKETSISLSAQGGEGVYSHEVIFIIDLLVRSL